MPVQFVPNLIAALQEHMRVFSETYTNVGWSKHRSWPIHVKQPAPLHACIRIETLHRAEQHPNADTELHYRNAFELLVATILSAQSTDQRVNMVTPALFKRYRMRARWRGDHRPSSRS